ELREHRRLLSSINITELRGTPHQWPILQQVATTREPLIVPDITRHSLFGIDTVPPGLRIKAFATVPLITTTNHLIGTISLLDFEPLKLTAPQIDLFVVADRGIA